ncbi:Dipeptide transport system permease protein DppB (plasmid) [Sulfitobacter indolifex]|uniref:ABC transporter permease n=1 Tax=Sulfitobacter indolifex TaxID=225422 RepID=UPI002055F8D8|nr:ABC transporter permease [Sulfitobacter indolifex]UOA20610.1 Dipeptide transport system permease protein DppB [Sulfitobacter indolifex]UOA20821.1 Dipeptide transport system permease protein DppB [Sulfitobacter indolifex]
MSRLLLSIVLRLAKAVAVILAIVLLNFILIRLAPGDPASVMAGQAGAADEKFMLQLRSQFGLDQPLPVQAWDYIAGIFQGDLGYSYRQGTAVSELILDRLPATLLLTGTAFAIALLGGIAMGSLAGLNAGRPIDFVISVVSLIFYATPLFWVGLMSILLFSVYLDWLPAFGMTQVGSRLTSWAYFLDVARHLVLPATTLGLFYMAVYARMTRASILEVRDQDFVRTARAMGLPRRRIVRSHILRNALLPIITLAGIQAGQLVGGAILTETVFGWPGIGRLAFDALLQRDYQVLLGVFFVTSIMVVAFNIITDLLYRVIDPRIGAEV